MNVVLGFLLFVVIVAVGVKLRLYYLNLLDPVPSLAEIQAEQEQFERHKRLIREIKDLEHQTEIRPLGADPEHCGACARRAEVLAEEERVRREAVRRQLELEELKRICTHEDWYEYRTLVDPVPERRCVLCGIRLGPDGEPLLKAGFRSLSDGPDE